MPLFLATAYSSPSFHLRHDDWLVQGGRRGKGEYFICSLVLMRYLWQFCVLALEEETRGHEPVVKLRGRDEEGDDGEALVDSATDPQLDTSSSMGSLTPDSTPGCAKQTGGRADRQTGRQAGREGKGGGVGRGGSRLPSAAAGTCREISSRLP